MDRAYSLELTDGKRVLTTQVADMGGIYQIRHVRGGQLYIGSAVKFRRRFSEHISRLRASRHHSPHLQNAWDKHGADSFTFEPLLICAPEHLLMYEQLVIDGLRPVYNMNPTAGSSLGRSLSPETRAKIAAKAIGRKRTRESIEAGSAKRRGVPLSPEHRATLLGNKRALGQKHTDEWKAANSERMRGVPRPKTPEHREKLAMALRGRKATPESRANQAAAQLGKVRGPYKKRVSQ